MTRVALAIAILILSGCSSSAPPDCAPPQPPKLAADIVESFRRTLSPEKPVEPPAVVPPPPVVTPPKAAPPPAAKPPKAKQKKVERKVKPRKRERERKTRKAKPAPKVVAKPDNGGPDLQYPCWLVRQQARGRTGAQLEALGVANNIKLSAKQRRQARECLR